MQPSQAASAPSPQTSNRDIIFACNHCNTPLVVDVAAAGLAVECQACSKPTRVPTPPAEVSSETAAKISDLQHQLKENESQRTEITSYIHQHSIQLHRWQLRLKDLNDRKARLDGELAAIAASGA
jgi:transcription elongation factor Elf1